MLVNIKVTGGLRLGTYKVVNADTVSAENKCKKIRR